MSVLMKIMNERRSIRSYSDRPVESDTLEKILKAALLAPSASNRQKWKIIIVQDEQRRKEVGDACDGQKFMYEAPVHVIFVSSDPRDMYCGVDAGIVDTSILASFFILAAWEEGLGTCWLGHFSQEALKDVLNLPKEWEIIAVTPLGYPSFVPKARPRKTLEEVVIEEQV